MGKLTLFGVAFPDNPHGIFNPGNKVNGNVVVNLTAPMGVKAVRIRFHGEAFVQFHDKVKVKYTFYSTDYKGKRSKKYSYTRNKKVKRNSYTRNKKVKRKERTTYYDKTFVLYGKGSGGASEHGNEIAAGQNAFPFTLQLRKNLPSSFEGKYGHVRYSLKATLVKPWKFNESTKRAFTVLDMVDLSKNKKLSVPVYKSFTKTYCCWCCRSGPIEVYVEINKKGFVPGEFIMIGGNLENFSSKDILSTKTTIIQQVEYRAEGRRKFVKNTVAKVKGPGCKREEKSTINHMLRVPPLPPTMIEHCDIIEVDYVLQFTAKMPFMYSDLKATFGITIGSVPVQQTVPTLAAVPSTSKQVSQPSTSVIEVPVTAPPMHGPRPLIATAPVPPPSYEASVSGAVNIRDDDDRGDHFVGNTTFAPQYTYYNWSPPVAPEPVAPEPNKQTQLPSA